MDNSPYIITAVAAARQQDIRRSAEHARMVRRAKESRAARRPAAEEDPTVPAAVVTRRAWFRRVGSPVT
jgi:hypothetical protein